METIKIIHRDHPFSEFELTINGHPVAVTSYAIKNPSDTRPIEVTITMYADNNSVFDIKPTGT